MQARVKLSSDSLIEYLDFCYAIAEADCPTGEKGLEGIECVTGKVMICHVHIPKSIVAFGQEPQGWQSVLLSEDGRTLNELLPSLDSVMLKECVAELSFDVDSPRLMIGELPVRQALRDNERSALATLLPNLPPLRYPMSEEARGAFMKAYCKLPNRPMWVPVLVTDATIEQRKVEQIEVRNRHLKVLRQEVDAGKITPVDIYHTPVKHLIVGAFIFRSQAISYLERHGIAYDDTVVVQIKEDKEDKEDKADIGAICDVEPLDHDAPELLAHEDLQTLGEIGEKPTLSMQSTNGKNHNGYSTYWTDDRIESMFAYRKAHTIQKTVEKYGITWTALDAKIKKLNKRREADGKESLLTERQKSMREK